MDDYLTIRFRKVTAQRFKDFSGKVSGSHSESMERIIDFFEWHGFLPTERFNKGIGQEILKNRNRIDAVVAILKNIEKQQTLPTKAMLELLFEKSPQRPARQRQPSLFPDQTSQPERDRFFKKVEEAIGIERDNINLKLALKKNRAEFTDLINKIRLVKSSFGKPRLELDMDPKDFEKLKEKVGKE